MTSSTATVVQGVFDPAPSGVAAVVSEIRQTLLPLVERLTASVAALDSAARGRGLGGVTSDTAAMLHACRELSIELGRCLRALPAAFAGQIDIGALRHDLRTPLNAVKGYADLIGEDVGDDGVLKAALGSVLTDVEALLPIIDGEISSQRVAGGRAGPTLAVANDTMGTAPIEGPSPGTDGRVIDAADVLVVDDNEANRKLLARRLEREGHRPVMVEDGEAALAHLARAHIDLVLLDYELPGLNGPDVLRAMRRNASTADIPVVMISAGIEIGRIVDCLDLGADDYLPKPFHPGLLRARVSASLERKRLREREAASWQERLRALMEVQPDGMAIIDPDGRIEAANGVLCSIFHVPAGDLAGSRLADHLVGVDDWLPGPWLARHRGQTEDDVVSRELLARRRDGDAFSLELSLRRFQHGDRERFAATLRDISARKAAEARNLYLARHDTITGLLNRGYFEELVQSCLVGELAYQGGGDEGDASGAILSVASFSGRELVASVPRATYNLILREIGDRLRRVFGAHARLARLSGDEYAVLLPGVTDLAAIQDLGQRAIEVLRAPIGVDANLVFVDPFVAATMFPADGDSVARLMRNIDLAALAARVSGESVVCLFDDEMRRKVHARGQIQRDLRVAVTNRQFELHYQPKIKLADGSLAAAEALIRWRHPEQGMVSPGNFIPIAEETGLILDLGAWSLDEVLRQIAVWDAAGLHVPSIAVNISALQFQRQDLVALLRQGCANHGVAPSRIEFEITESVLMRDADEMRRLLISLRDIGISLSIDDFGTGYSNLGYLQHLPVDKLKIDQSFVRRLAEDEVARNITGMIVGLSRAMSLSTVAEGVETNRQREVLVELGCVQGQGYLWSRPLQAERFLEFAKAAAKG
jgi:PAS domain S-box-containing protein